jgi:PPOX class probable F420-dependent enzyme
MKIATAERVGRDELLAFVRPRRNLLLVTSRGDGRTQISPVTGAVDTDGRLLVSSYPTRAKVVNLRKRPACSIVVLSDDFNGPWVQLYGEAQIVDGEAGVERLVDYYRAAAGEHDDWEEYRQAMRDRSKVAIDIAITDWGPIATGGLPPEFADGT